MNTDIFLGGILTVADDFLTGDGKKFLDLMEALSNRKVIRNDNAGVKNPKMSMAGDSTAKITSLSDNEWDDYDEGSVSDDFEEDEEVLVLKIIFSNMIFSFISLISKD